MRELLISGEGLNDDEDDDDVHAQLPVYSVWGQRP